MKVESEEAIPALKLVNRTYATAVDKAETLNSFFSCVSTIETLGAWDIVKEHVNKLTDDLSFTTEIF